MAHCLKQIGVYTGTEALEIYEEILATEPDHIEALFVSIVRYINEYLQIILLLGKGKCFTTTGPIQRCINGIGAWTSTGS
jgi:hypothetical protein